MCRPDYNRVCSGSATRQVNGKILDLEVSPKHFRIRIKIVFKNNASHPYSMHPHGVLYQKDSEGADYNDGTSGADKSDGGVRPRRYAYYVWQIPELAGSARVIRVPL